MINLPQTMSASEISPVDLIPIILLINQSFAMKIRVPTQIQLPQWPAEASEPGVEFRQKVGLGGICVSAI